MSPHVHIGLLEFGIFLAMYLVAGFLLRVLQLRYPDSPFGKALGFIHG